MLIPTYNRSRRLFELLKKLENQTYKNFEVIVIDDGSTDETKLMVENIDVSYELRYYYKKNEGTSSAQNYGIEKAKGDIIAHTNDDCLPDDDWLENALKYFNNKNVVGVEGLVYTNFRDKRVYRTISNEEFLKGKKCLLDGFFGANILYKKDVLKKVGGLDERFKPFFREDSDLAWRALDHGKIVFAKDVRVFHPAHISKKSGFQDRYLFRKSCYMNDALLYSKHKKKYLEYHDHSSYDIFFWYYLIKGMKRFGVYVPIQRLYLKSIAMDIKRLINSFTV